MDDADREAMWLFMDTNERLAYTRGVAHAFGDVFNIISALIGELASESVTLGTALEQLSARWGQLKDDFTVKGVL